MTATISHMKPSLAIAAALILAACGGGGGDPAPSASAPPAAQPAALVTIAAYGDSTQRGLMFISPEVGYVISANAPPKVSQRKLREWASQERIVVLNEGVGGTTLHQLLTGTDGKHKPWAQEMAESPAQIIAINHSLNLVGHTTEQFKAQMVEVVKIAQAAGKKVVVETSNPIVPGTPTTNAIGPDDVLLRARAALEAAAMTGATPCDQFGAIKDAGMVSFSYMPDGVHPDGDLYHFKGIKQGQCLLPLVLGILGVEP